MPTAPKLTGLDFIRNPELVQQLVDLLFALRNVNVQLVVGQDSQALSAGKVNIVGSAPALTLPLPLKLAKPIADSTADAASVSAQLNLLLAALRKTGQLPS